ncbi:hypothetical protein [Paraburkholderia tagetis]|uniref:Uncharacterized protein n=1 Tax=Paraburkholderia tagetis TaxID=2913261 RepID=A0A9X1RWY7_9BURK|nr:hypothetical protein [Paraburkholderia tagetis]MCG5076669.1 hypothetical protein [Paraburkholderia tagetis]
MRTQTNHSNSALQRCAEPAISVAGWSADMQSVIWQNTRTGALDCCAEHKGYRLEACARPSRNELYAADLVIGRPGFPSRRFRALDYFYDPRQALGYATRWGRIWIDHQVKKHAGNAGRLDDREPLS